MSDEPLRFGTSATSQLTLRERAALHDIMTAASYLRRGSTVRRTIEDAASAALRFRGSEGKP